MKGRTVLATTLLVALASLVLTLGLYFGLRDKDGPSSDIAENSVESPSGARTSNIPPVYTITPPRTSDVPPGGPYSTMTPPMISDVPPGGPYSTMTPPSIPRTTAGSPNSDVASFSNAVLRLEDAQAVRVQSALFGNVVDISFDSQGEGTGTIEIRGKDLELLVVDKRAFVRNQNSAKWAYFPSLYQLINVTISPTETAKIFFSAMRDGYASSNETVNSIPALKASTRAGDLYITADLPHQVIRMVIQNSALLLDSPPLRRLMGVASSSVKITIDVTDLNDDVDATAEIPETIADIIPNLKNAFDLSAQFDTSGSPVLSCSSSSCLVTISVSTSFVSENLVAKRVSATLTATMTVDGAPAGECTSSAFIPVNGASTMSCTNGSPAYVSAYARAAKPRSRAPRFFPILARTQVISRAYADPDVEKLTSEYNSIVRKVHSLYNKRTHLYQISYGKKIWKYGITSEEQWQTKPRALVQRCQSMTKSECAYRLQKTYLRREMAYRRVKELVDKYGSVPTGQSVRSSTKRPTACFAVTTYGARRKLLERAECVSGKVKVNSGTRRITLKGLQHSFDRHASKWFGRKLTFTSKKQSPSYVREWKSIIEKVTTSGKQIDWSSEGAPTVGHVAYVNLNNDGFKLILVQYYKGGPKEGQVAGDLATAVIPNKNQLKDVRLKTGNAIPRLIIRTE